MAIEVHLSRRDLCLIQQSLGLREMVIVNSNGLSGGSPPNAKDIIEVRELRNRVIAEIRHHDRQNPVHERKNLGRAVKDSE